jgi:hypothetical protein
MRLQLLLKRASVRWALALVLIVGGRLAFGESYTAPVSSGSGSGVSTVSSNGVSISGAATSLNLVAGTNVVLTSTNTGGAVSVGIHAAAGAGGGSNLTTLAAGSATLGTLIASNAIVLPWVAKTNAAVVNANSGPNQYANLVVNSNLTFVPLSASAAPNGDASNSIPIKVSFTQDITGQRTLTFNGIALGVDTNSAATTECFFWIQNGATNVSIGIPFFTSVAYAGQFLTFNGFYWTNGNWVPLLNAGIVNASSNLNASALQVTNTAGASNFVASGGGTNMLGPTRTTNNLGVVVGSTTSNAMVGGTLYVDISSRTNHSTVNNYTNLATFTIPAHLLTNSADEAESEWSGVMLSGTNRFVLGFGSITNLMDLSGMTNGHPLSTWRALLRVTRTGNTGQRVYARFDFDPGFGIQFATTNRTVDIAETNGIANLIRLQASAIRAGGITNNYQRVTYKPASQ